MSDQPLVGRDFDTWANLARTDPEAFESLRQAAIEQCIANAPAENRDRLRRLQWRIDQERRRAGTPLGACIRLSRMMWQSLLGEGGLRDRFAAVGDLLTDGSVAPPPDSARILAFARDSRR